MKSLVIIPVALKFLIVENKGLVPEGYVRFLNEEEERQYLEQSPPSNTLLPPLENQIPPGSGEETPRQTTRWPSSSHVDQDDWTANTSSGGQAVSEDWVGITTAVENVGVR